MKKGVFFLCLVLAVIVFENLPNSNDNNVRNEMANKLMKFDASNINGRLSSFWYQNKGDAFELISDSVHYFFRSYTDYKTGQMFSSLVEKGDSVSKPSKARFLKLIKPNGKVYEFEFQR